MNDIIFFLLLGLGVGSLYAMLGAGLVVVYKGSGVINFGYGAMAMYGMFTFDTAWNRGEFFLPWVDIVPTHELNLPVRITLSDSGSWPLAPSILLALCMSALIGLAVHFLVFRPLRNSAPLGKVVASLGIALYLQGVALLNFGNSFPVPRSVVPDDAIDNFLGMGQTYPANGLYAVGFAVLMGLGLGLLYRYTRFGLATRAAAGNEKGAVLLGYSPQFLAAVNWVLASVLATTAVIVVGPLQGSITPIGLTALIVPALAAALIGRLQSVPLAVAGGLGLGMITTLLDIRKADWFDGPLTIVQNGVTDSVPLLVIVAVLFFRGRSLPIRGTVEEKRLPLSPTPQRMLQHSAVWIVVVTLLAHFWEDAGPRTVFAGGLQTSLVFMIIMLSMVVLTGYVGQISLAQMSMAGVAAFVMARMMADGEPRGANLVPVTGPDLPWPIAALIGVAIAVVVGVVLGLPAVRIRGVQLAVVTIAAAVSLQSLYLENDRITGLRAGVPAVVKTPTLLGIDVGSRSERFQNDRPAFAVFAVIILALVAMGIANIRRTGVGRRFLAVRANERAAAAAGISVVRTKLLAFGLSAGIAGIGGVMLAFKQVEVSSANFPYQASLVVLAFAYLAGITSINGGIVGGLLVAGSVGPIFGNYFLSGVRLESYTSVLGGFGLILTAILFPGGQAPHLAAGFRHMGNWTAGAVPGAQTLHIAYVGPRRRELNVILFALLIATALFIYHLQVVEAMVPRLAVTALIVWIIVMALAGTGRYGRFAPDLAETRAVWTQWVHTFGATALIGYVGGWILWPLRTEAFSKFWMPVLGMAIALFIRSNLLQIRAARAAKRPTPMAIPDTSDLVEVA